MKNITYIALGIAGSFVLLAPTAFASTSSLSLQSISPGTSVSVSNRLSFVIASPGFIPNAYQISDSASNSTVSSDDITGAGNFSWVPVTSDVGTHVLSITATDSSGDSANTTQTITVMPAPSVSASAVSPGATILPGTKFTFSLSAIGFTNPSYLVTDAFGGSSVTDADLTSSGNFSWTPADISQDGSHIITVYVYDSLGHSASVNVPVQVGAGAGLGIQSLSPGSSLSPLQTLSFMATGNSFSPTSFAVSDSFPNTTITNSNITTSGSFSWVPQASNIGTHVLTITGTVGVYGQSASTTETITVLGTPAAAVVTASPVSTTAVVAAPSSAGFTFTTSLYSGMQSSAVTQLQTILAQQGYFTGAVSGYYGALTTAAVERFQAAHGLSQLGVVGPGTRAALNALGSTSQTTASTASSPTTSSSYAFQNPVTFGQSGADVLALQKRLATLGFFSGVPSGYFGDATLDALIQFQQSKGLAPVDQLGDATRAALNQ